MRILVLSRGIILRAVLNSQTYGEQSEAVLQFGRAYAIGEESELADTNQSGREHVEQEAADELDCIQSRDCGAALVSVVLPVKADAAVFEGSKAVIGNGHAVSVASQILENALGPPKGGLA